jgi:putative transposase
MPQKDALLSEIIKKTVGTQRIGREKVIRKVLKEHPALSVSKIRRVYQKGGFSLFKRMRKRRPNQPANPIDIPLEPLEEWAIDFMSDSLVNGRSFRTLNVIDHFNRACMGIYISTSIPAKHLTTQLEQMIELNGKPQRIRTDNGPEFTSKHFQLWLQENSIQWQPIQPGKPQQNALVERFNRTYREDVLDAHLFKSIEEATQITSQWIEEYNHKRPHQALDYKTPMEYAA